jgi:transposase InsO family protein
LLICLLLTQLSQYKRRQPLTKLRPAERLFLRFIAGLLPANLWRDFLCIVQPDTLVRWNDSLWNVIHGLRGKIGKYFSRKQSGRPLQYREIIGILKTIVPQNPLWGHVRIWRELSYLGYDIPLTTLRRYIKRIFPHDPRLLRLRAQWKAFLKNQASSILAMDFFTIKIFPGQTLYCWFLIEHSTREILHINVTFHPTAFWVAQQLREALAWEHHFRYLIFDRDSIFSAVKSTIKNCGLSPCITAIRSPWQNPFAERWIRSIRRELLDRVIVTGEKHARILIAKYVHYYNRFRPHMGLEGRSPLGRPVSRGSPGSILVSQPAVNGLHHIYTWQKEAA